MTGDPMVSASTISTAAVVVLFKSSLVVGFVALATRRRFAPSASTRSRASLAVFVVLAALPLMTGLATWDPAGFDVPHGLLERPLAPSLGPWSFAIVLAMLWGIGALWHIGRFLLDWRAVGALARSARPVVGGRMVSLVRRSSALVGVRARVRVLASDALDAPAVIGWRRPIILLPTATLRWSDDEIIAVLTHELAHVRRHDWPAFLFERLMVALYWPNPLVSLAARRAADARELAADRVVLCAGADPVSYAMRLIDVARSSTRPEMAAALSLARPRHLDERIRALFDQSAPGPQCTPWVTSVAFVAIVVATVIVQPLRCLP